KYTSDACGKWNAGPSEIDGITALPSSAASPSTLPGVPQNVSKKPFPWPIGLPKPILNAHKTHATSTSENATKVSIMLLTDQRFCMTPPYRTARPGRLISPTKVAAVICHALSPAFSQLGYASQDICLRFPAIVDGGTVPNTWLSAFDIWIDTRGGVSWYRAARDPDFVSTGRGPGRARSSGPALL